MRGGLGEVGMRGVSTLYGIGGICGPGQICFRERKHAAVLVGSSLETRHHSLISAVRRVEALKSN